MSVGAELDLRVVLVLSDEEQLDDLGGSVCSPMWIDGRLWFVPAKFVQNNSISSWDLPDEL